MMKITGVEVFILKKKLSASMRISRGGFTVRTHAIVRVTTDDGLTGLGEGVGNPTLVKAIIDGQIGCLAIGLNPLEIERVRAHLTESQVYYERKGSAICAVSAIEMACWDIKGKALGIPCYQLLGGMYQDKIEAYASDIYWEEDPESIARNASRIVTRGFRTVKAHLGCASPKAEAERIRAIRDAIGDDIKLMVDLNAGYSFADAAQAGLLWEPFKLTWLEEPLHPDQITALTDLRRRCNIPIATGENEFGVAGFKCLLEAGCVDFVMPDIGRVGGIQETKNVCMLASTYGIPASPHNFSSGVLLAATIHVMASTPNVFMLEMDTSDNAVYEELLLDGLEFRDGKIAVMNSPGLGVELKPETLSKYGHDKT